MDYIITGRGAFVDIEVCGDVLCVAIAWIDKFCPPNFEVPGVGVVATPANLIRLNTATLIPNLELQIIKHHEPSPTV